MVLDRDTIVAVATPAGRGGIGVVRLSGAASVAIAEGMLRLRRPLIASQARLTQVVDGAGEVLDEAVVTWFQAPHSYTTEEVVEIAVHGAPVLLEYVVQAAVGAGARLAGPGEFTQRAFLSGRLDLTQAEAVHDLVAAQTLQQAKTAAAQLGGAVARVIAPYKRSLVELIATLEAGVDFAEDDLDLLPEAEVAGRIAAVEAPLRELAASYAYGRMVREGLTLAIVGAPNAGKSSLFNRLLKRERAIVTAVPGTTRDTISEQVALDGIPVNLVDTAGLRDIALTPETEAERAGIARSREVLAEADVVLHVVDGSALGETGRLRDEDEALQAGLAGRASLLVLNKADLGVGLVAERASAVAMGAVAVSALTGAGLEELRARLRAMIAGRPAADSAVITNVRQSEAISGAVQALGRAGVAAGKGVSQEFLLLDLHKALERLDELTGATAAEEILGLIFSKFCVGK